MTRISAAAATPKSTAAHTPKFPGKLKNAGWSPGSGIRIAYMGLFVDVQTNPMTKLSARMKLDEKTKTITVTLKGKAGMPNRAADITKHMEIGTPRGMHFGQKYNLVVQDANHHVLKKTTFTPYPAA